MKNEVNNKPEMSLEERTEENQSSMSRRAALKYLGVGALGTMGALYGLNQPVLANYISKNTEETNAVSMAGIASTKAKDKHMKVVLINGSPRKNGNTFTALSEVAKTLEEEGVSTSLIQLGTQSLQGCIQCNACKESGACVFNDSVYSQIREQLTEADGIIIGSPVYFAGPNGALCAVLDRLFYTSGNLLSYKVGAAVAVCRRGGATATLDRLNKYFTISNMLIIGSQYWNIAHGAAVGEVLEDKEGMQIMRTLGRNTAWTIKNIKIGQQPYPEMESRIRTDFVKKY